MQLSAGGAHPSHTVHNRRRSNQSEPEPPNNPNKQNSTTTKLPIGHGRRQQTEQRSLVRFQARRRGGPRPDRAPGLCEVKGRFRGLLILGAQVENLVFRLHSLNLERGF